MITLSMQVHPMDDNIARQKSEMYDAEMTLGMISMTQAVDSYRIFLSFFYFYSIAINRRIL